MQTRKGMEFTDLMGVTDSVVSSEPRHTPTPWVLEGNSINGKDFEGCIAMASGKSAHQNLINAAYIVRAVNSHEELLRAAKAMHDEFLSHSRGSVAHEDCWWCAAIARAEGK